MKPKIFCFNNGGSTGLLHAVAIAEDGHCLAQHCCSHEYYMAHDLGITSTWKHEHYKEHYPDGYELVWVPSDERKTHGGLVAAIARSKELAAEGLQ